MAPDSLSRAVSGERECFNMCLHLLAPAATMAQAIAELCSTCASSRTTRALHHLHLAYLDSLITLDSLLRTRLRRLGHIAIHLDTLPGDVCCHLYHTRFVYGSGARVLIHDTRLYSAYDRHNGHSA